MGEKNSQGTGFVSVFGTKYKKVCTCAHFFVRCHDRRMGAVTDRFDSVKDLSYISSKQFILIQFNISLQMKAYLSFARIKGEEGGTFIGYNP